MNVSKLTESENLELFKIILDTKANYTKNNNGIFLNLNWIEEELLVKINNYILFCIKSQNEISKYELMKTLLNEDMSSGGDCITRNSCDAAATAATAAAAAAIADTSKDAGDAGDAIAATSKDDASVSATDNTAGGGNTSSGTGTGTDSSGQVIASSSTIPKQKFSSSMKFYLLKKKFMKQNTCYNACLENDLSYEDYLIT